MPKARSIDTVTIAADQDAELEICVRAASRIDVPSIVAIHCRAFSGFLMTCLGPGFLSEYYRLVLSDPSGIGFVAEKASRLVGFAVGYIEPKVFFRAMRRYKLRLGIAMIPALLRDPLLTSRVWGSFRRANPTTVDDRIGLGELASVAVDPAYSGKGVGSQLVRAFLEEARARGVRGVYLTTDADRNDAVNRFYVGLGFSRVKTFRAARNRMMNEYRFIFEGRSEG